MIGRILRREELRPAEQRAMFALLHRHFEGATEAGFQRDLDDKNWVILLEEPDTGRLVGFSTIHYGRATDGEEPIAVISSGDTIVDPESWGRSRLASTWIHGVWSIHELAGNGETLWWLLLTSGFRTYRFLPVYWQQFHPRHDRPLPAELRVLRDRLATGRYGDRFDPESGVVRFLEPQRLRPLLRGVPTGRLRDPHVAFFHHANPHHEAGDELVSIVELGPHNLTPAGWREVERAGRFARPATGAGSNGAGSTGAGSNGAAAT